MEIDERDFEENEIEVEEIENEETEEKEPVITKIIDVDDITHTFDKKEVEDNMKYSILSYIGFLFLIPILSNRHKKSEYLLFHVNQGFNLFALEVFVFIIIGVLNSVFINVMSYAPIWLSIINFVMYTIVVVLMLFGIVNSINGKSKSLPLIGKYKFIK